MSLKFKSLNDGTIQIEGVGIPFGGPVNGKDLHGQFFSTKTDFAWDLIPDGHRPLLYQHGLDETVNTNVIGRWSVKKVDDKGVWITAQLNARAEYLDEIKELISADSLGLSSATMGHLVKVSSKSGEILRWPVVEMSLTPNPANPHAYVVKTAAPVEAAEYVAAKLAVLKYSEDQARDGNGRFGSGGGGSELSAGLTEKLAVSERQVSDVRSSLNKLTDKEGNRQFSETSTHHALADDFARHLAAGRTDLARAAASLGRQKATDLAMNGYYRGAGNLVRAWSKLESALDGKSLKADTVYVEGAGLVDGLRDLLSDVVAFYLESHGAHWNVVGDDFKQYHDLFGEIYEDVHGSVDPLAENIRKLNAAAPFDLRDIAADPALNNATGSVAAEELCEELYASNSVLLMKILSCFNMATEAGEQGIANFLAERQDAHKKWAWQLSASLDERGEQTEAEEAAESPELELDMSKSAKYSEDQARDGSGRFGSGGGGSSDSRADSATNPDVQVSQATTYLHDEYDRSEGDSRGAVMNAQDILDGHEQAGTASAPELAYARTFVLAARDINAHLAESRPVSLGQLQRDRAFFGKKQDTLSRMMDRLQDSPIGDDLRGVADDLSKSMDNVLDMHSSLEAALANKFFERPNADESVQPVVRLAIKAGKTTERKAADPDEVKKQMRALARDLAIKSVRK